MVWSPIYLTENNYLFGIVRTTFCSLIFDFWFGLNYGGNLTVRTLMQRKEMAAQRKNFYITDKNHAHFQQSTFLNSPACWLSHTILLSRRIFDKKLNRVLAVFRWIMSFAKAAITFCLLCLKSAISKCLWWVFR